MYFSEYLNLLYQITGEGFPVLYRIIAYLVFVVDKFRKAGKPPLLYHIHFIIEGRSLYFQYHPAKGVVLPEEFIPIAEETGMIGELSMGLMRRSFEEARNWDPGLVLSVNISPIQLRDAWFAQKLVKLLVETGFPPSRLEIEITETSLYENLQLAQSIVGSLKNQGIRLALDDFGTGYSSLSNLRALPFDRIKIDRSFVTSITDNPESAAIVNAIARLGDSLGLPVTAEGIENDEIARRLKEIGCHHSHFLAS